jgi:hypothetical protein
MFLARIAFAMRDYRGPAYSRQDSKRFFLKKEAKTLLINVSHG